MSNLRLVPNQQESAQEIINESILNHNLELCFRLCDKYEIVTEGETFTEIVIPQALHYGFAALLFLQKRIGDTWSCEDNLPDLSDTLGDAELVQELVDRALEHIMLLKKYEVVRNYLYQEIFGSVQHDDVYIVWSDDVLTAIVY